MRTGSGEAFQRPYPLRRQRMRLHVGVDLARHIENLVGKPLERFIHALGRLSGGREKTNAGAVGGILLRADIGEERILDRRLRRGQRRHAGAAAIAAGAGGSNHRGAAQDHCDDRGRRRHPYLLAHARQVTAGDVSGLVREHADHLVRRVRLHDRACVDEDTTAVGDERVEGALIDDHHLDILLRQAGSFQNRLGVFAQQLLDLGVAHDRRPGLPARLGLRRRRAGEPMARHNRQRDGNRHHPRGPLAAGCDRSVQGHANLKFRARKAGRRAASGFVAAIDNMSACCAHPHVEPASLRPARQVDTAQSPPQRPKPPNAATAGRLPLAHGRLNRCSKRRSG